MIYAVQILLLISILVTGCLPDSVSLAGAFVLFLTILFSVCIFLWQGRLSFLLAFSCAFAFMIPPEAILASQHLAVSWGEYNVLVGWRVLVVSFVALCIGGLVGYGRKKVFYETSGFLVANQRMLLNRAYPWMILSTILLFSLSIPILVTGFTGGRGSTAGLLVDIGLLGLFLTGLTCTTISFWGYYFYKTARSFPFVKALIFSSPLIVIALATGTRYRLLFAFCCVAVPFFYRMTKKRFFALLVCAFALLFVSGVVKELRYSDAGLSSWFQQEVSATSTGDGVVSMLAEKGSPEGLLRNMAMINMHTDRVGYTYGKSIGFLGIFWIPRSIWNDKPTQLDHWLIREYEHGWFGEGYSTASSFTGELFMDFGYFCVLCCFILGVLIAKYDTYLSAKYSNSYFHFALTGLLFGWCFFMVRSILTASFFVILALPVIWAFSRFVLKEKILTFTPPPPSPGREHCRRLR